MNSWKYHHRVFVSTALVVAGLLAMATAANSQVISSGTERVQYKTAKIDGLDIFYRQAGDPAKPAILLLHGFPSSSHMFRNLIPQLADRFFVVAPDYPGFGYSSAPPADKFDYTFDNLARVVEKFTRSIGLEKYILYVQDYGAPVGYRIAVGDPARVAGLVVQNGNAYEEGLRGFWNPLKAYWEKPTKENGDKLREFLKPEATKWQYTHGARSPENISPDSYTFDQVLLDRPGNHEIQLKLFLDYGSNPPLYPQWQEYFRKHQPPTLVVWGKNDQIFPAEGAAPYKRDLKNIELHLLNTGHFALEEDGDIIAARIRNFFSKQIGKRIRDTRGGRHYATH
jgi:pimeloyl-ACP methyl ester carboxylesterase